MTPVQPRPAFVKFVPGQGFVADNDKASACFTKEATVTAGVVRWSSNGAVPPSDVLAQWAGLDLPFDLARSTEAHNRDIDEFAEEYRQRAPRRVSSEERYEMRAAFGRGKRVVNIFTGRVTRT